MDNRTTKIRALYISGRYTDIQLARMFGMSLEKVREIIGSNTNNDTVRTK